LAPPEPPRPGLLLRAQLFLATGAGTGYAPIAPGTAGSLPGLLLYWALYQAGGTLAVLIALPPLLIAGIWCATAAEGYYGRTDPGHVVVDEILGQMVTLLFLPPTLLHLTLGFFVFRILDIIKPYPASRLEKLHGGSGIMLDDLAAGVYGALLLHLLHWFGTRI
jgi:phosphatidylglycerophosphatase A